MASMIYYGVSNTAANVQTKNVAVIGSTASENGVNLMLEGDLLVVLFQNNNTEDSPKLRISNGDSNFNTSVTSDSGVAIKVQSIDISLDGAWAAGETKTFVWTKGAGNVYYFEMLGSVKASNGVFGNVVVVNSDGDPDGSVAISVEGARELLNSATNFTLDWDTSFTSGDSNPVLGTLSLIKDGETLDDVVIRYPAPNIPTYSHTHQFINDGPQQTAIDAGNPFLTKYVPDKIYFYGVGSTTGLHWVERENNTWGTASLIYEMVDGNGNTNIWGHQNLTLNAKSGYTIRLGGTSGWSGNTSINGTLSVHDLATLSNGLTVSSGTTNLKNTNINNSTLNVSGSFVLNGHNVHIGTQVPTAEETPVDSRSVTLYDAVLTSKNLKSIICEIQDGSIGVDRVSIELGGNGIPTGYFTVHFNKKKPDAYRIRINYIAFSQ